MRRGSWGINGHGVIFYGHPVSLTYVLFSDARCRWAEFRASGSKHYFIDWEFRKVCAVFYSKIVISTKMTFSCFI